MVYHKVHVVAVDTTDFPILCYSVVVICDRYMTNDAVREDAIDAVRTMASAELEISDFNRIARYKVVSIISQRIPSLMERMH